MKIVRPVKGSKRFFQDARFLQGIMTRRPDGTMADEGEKRELGSYEKERFHGSRQILRGAQWSSTERRWKMDPLSQKELNELVAQCDLYDSKGEKITSANPRRFADPFFMHHEFMIFGEEGEQELDDDNNPMHKLLAIGFANRDDFGDGKSKHRSTLQRWEIIDKSTTISQNNDDIDLWAEIASLFKATPVEKLRKIGIILNVGISEDSSYDIVKSTLGKLLMGEDKVVTNSTETYKEGFIRLCNLPEDKFNLEYMVALGVRKGFIRKRRNQGWLYNGKPITTVDSQLVPYFEDPSNQDDYFELEKLVDDTSKDSTS